MALVGPSSVGIHRADIAFLRMPAVEESGLVLIVQTSKNTTIDVGRTRRLFPPKVESDHAGRVIPAGILVVRMLSS